ncbi:MAG: RIP metalloprotease RseP, partial [Gammaproteobacteria bacterium]|nr:RIP metalloprotease RseP [Gammaproteobacteria bacterium]
MDSFLYSVVFFILALGVLIAIHEYGHFWVARKMGVKVLRYSIGFGRPLWKKVKGEDQTEYVVAAIPLGGYVKMLDEREEPVAPHELHRAFNRQSLKTRIAIVAAGPVANFLFAIAAYWIMFLIGVPGLKPLVGDVVPDSIFDRAGVVAGDEVVSVRGEGTPTMESMRIKIIESVLNNEVAQIEVRRGASEPLSLQLDLTGVSADQVSENLLQHIGYTPERPRIPAVIDTLVEDGAGKLAGMKAGDRVLSVDGTPVTDWSQWAAYVRQRPEKLIEVKLERGSTQLTLSVA